MILLSPFRCHTPPPPFLSLPPFPPKDFLDFTPYMGRFNMPNMDKGWMYYAFTYGGVRFLALDTEDALGTGLAPGLYPGKPQARSLAALNG